jgi:putative phosphoribosyl transferase
MIDADFDVIVARKIGVPGQPELAIGAVAPDGQVILDHALIGRIRISEHELTGLIAVEQEEARRRLTAYRGNRSPLDVRDRVAILVDDGLATGATMAIAVRVLRTQEPKSLIAAAPVGSQYAIDLLKPVADAVVCPLAPRDLMAVGAYYEDFGETSDQTVRGILAQANRADQMI